jgi:hypothetical protein
MQSIRSSTAVSIRKRWLAAAAVLLLPFAVIDAQGLREPRSIRQAIAKGTRTQSGQPGPNYWQNSARYSIDITVTPRSRTVQGAETITYYNNSPDTLREIVVRLFMNIHKPGAPRLAGVGAEYLTDGVSVDSFAVNGATTPWQPGSAFTSVPVHLGRALAPHDSLRVAFRWHYMLAKEPAREGMIDSTTAYLAYFYPRVAVYDDYEGWDRTEFTDLQEFYSDFNDYDVTVRVPANYVVWGTGTLTNAAQLLEPEALRRFETSLTSDTTVHIATRQDMLAHRATTQSAENAWHFAAQRIPDVAFGVSDHYDWDAGSAVIDSTTHRRASVQAAYNDTAADFHGMVGMARHSLQFMSHQWPGVPYPFEKSTVFQGGAGMEYPMMVNDESYPDSAFADLVAAHEIAHTWFPFYMGINETRYPFMDEGWATTSEYLIGTVNVGRAGETKIFQNFRVAPWVRDSSPLEELPVITPADVVKAPTYRTNAYGKPALGYLAVKDLLGDSVFRRALHAYMNTWHGRHPTPWDFFATFNTGAGRNLDWFWNNWFFGSGTIDLAVTNVSRAAGGYTVTLENVGGLAAPVDLVLTFADGSTQTVHESIAMWEGNQRRTTVSVPTTKMLRTLQLSGDIWMDANPANDRWPDVHSQSTSGKLQ